MQKSVQERNITIDLLKILLAFSVVGIHTSFLKDTFPSIGYILGDGIFRAAVPIFFVINGYFFYSISELKKHKNWYKRIMILYLIWMAFYSIFWAPKIIDNDQIWLEIVLIFVFGYGHLWYLSAIIGAAALILILKKQKTKVLFALAIILYLTGTIMQYIGNYLVLENQLDTVFDFMPFYRNFLFTGFPFFAMGYLICRTDFSKRINTRFLSVLFILAIIFLITESIINFNFSNEGFDLLFSLIILGPILFLLALKNEWKSKKGKSLSQYSSGLYFIHIFWQAFILSDVFPTNSLSDNSVLLFSVVCLISILSTYFLIKINHLAKFIL